MWLWKRERKKKACMSWHLCLRGFGKEYNIFTNTLLYPVCLFIHERRRSHPHLCVFLTQVLCWLTTLATKNFNTRADQSSKVCTGPVSTLAKTDQYFKFQLIVIHTVKKHNAIQIYNTHTRIYNKISALLPLLAFLLFPPNTCHALIVRIMHLAVLCYYHLSLPHICRPSVHHLFFPPFFSLIYAGHLSIISH